MKKSIYKKVVCMGALTFFAVTAFSFTKSDAQAASAKKIPKGYTGIYTEKDLKKISKKMNGKYILMKNINLKGSSKKVWKAIGFTSIKTSGTPFTGIINGNGHTISNAYFSNKAGLVSCNKGTIKNLTLKGKAKPTTNTSYGMLTSLNSGTISNCSIKFTIETPAQMQGYFGGISAQNNGIISECTVKGTAKLHCTFGGIAFLNNAGHISNCKNQMKIYASVQGGGICAQNKCGTISNCKNFGKITVVNAPTSDTTVSNGGKFKFGGIVGGNWGYLSKCTNEALLQCTIAHSYVNLGGIVGENRIQYTSTAENKFDSSISSCKNTGAVLVTKADAANVGGIVGYHDSCAGAYENSTFNVSHFDLSLYFCTNKGKISAISSYSGIDYSAVTGGIIGNLDCGEQNQVTLYKCSNTGSINASGVKYNDTEYSTVVSSGIVGLVTVLSQKGHTYCHVVQCTNAGNVFGSNTSAGILCNDGSVQNPQVKSCSNSGKISGDSGTDKAFAIASSGTTIVSATLPANCKTTKKTVKRWKTISLATTLPVTSWSVSNRKLASVSTSGKVTTLRKGTVTVTAYLKEGKKISWKIKVTK